MVAIDTNVLIRLLTMDDAAQYRASQKLFASEEVFIPDTVILESAWVLRHAYEFAPAAISSSFRKLFGLPTVCANSKSLVAQVLDWYDEGLDFADAFHLALSQHQETLKTFDADFIKRAKKLSSCQVEKV